MTEDGSPRPGATFALWEPPLTEHTGEHGAPLRRSAAADVAGLLADLVERGARTLAFVRSRRGAESVAEQARALLRQARKRFRALGMNIRTKHDDGRVGWAEHGPFDAIVVTAAAPALVDALIEQLAEGGRLVAPVGGPGAQSLVQLDRKADGSIEQHVLAPVTFVPLLSGMLD